MHCTQATQIAVTCQCCSAPAKSIPWSKLLHELAQTEVRQNVQNENSFFGGGGGQVHIGLLLLLLGTGTSTLHPQIRKKPRRKLHTIKEAYNLARFTNPPHKTNKKVIFFHAHLHVPSSSSAQLITKFVVPLTDRTHPFRPFLAPISSSPRNQQKTTTTTTNLSILRVAESKLLSCVLYNNTQKEMSN
jgi:hypothetical protein